LIDALGHEWEAIINAAPVRVFETLRGVGPTKARAAARSWEQGRGARASRGPSQTR
jgi:hypothetical protein